jgi:DEAD/DEAH box helicase domain-containing protein
MLSHYYASEYNEDRKLLAFTDSVQDASHRAGFFGSRTYRFNLRRAIQVMLESTEEEPLLTEAAESVTRFWRPDVGVEKLVATLMPPDLREYPGYQAFLSSSKNEVPPALLQGLLTRLSWEIVMEYGHAVRVGRTLETTLCSTARFDSAQIDRVARELKLDIEEQDLLGPPSRVVSEENVRHWLWGLLRRWRVRGGITHPLLGRYLRAGADRFQLSKYAEPLLSPFGPGSVLPVFITDRGIEPGHRALESVVVSGERHGWYRDWAIRALSPMLTVDSLTELHRIALRRLANVGILENRQNQQVSTWGIRPEALRLTKHVTELLCTMCRRHYTVTKDEREILIDKRCPQYRCGGHLADAPIEPNTYYANYYRSGRLERIFPREHTGMLSRKQREEIEERFKQGTSPDGPNLIVCTPTLEMGIDVGDLSATMLCSVPPSTANFLQRIGRAGRRTGNALCLTMAVSRPHDLYFQAEPMEMLSGAVLPPGCFLDAPEILKRQFVAYAMDAWAAHEGDDVKIPRNCAMVLTEAGWAAFPGRFLEFYKREQSRLLDSFLEMFGSGLSPANLERIRQYGVSTEVTEAITDAFETVRRERDELRSMYKRANRRHAEIGRNPESADDPEVDKNELGEALAVIRRLIEELGNKYTLNVLTDEGVIPNYAFPEPGVYLDSVIRIERPNAAIKHRTYTFLRPASSAIREFAPFNSFYADGRKVRIDEVDLGTRDRSRLEDWRFCPACNHMELVGEQRDTAEGCPRCKTDGWTDAGQVRTLVNFRRARSLTGSPTAAVTDDSDDREEQYYELQELIDVGPENLCGARAIKSLPFGVELLRDLRMRQVNFGMAGPAIGGGMEVAGQNLSASGFEVCAFCGRVRGANGRIDGASQIRHLPQCRSRRPGMKEKTRTIHLYRQIASEAIRILLPVSQVGHDAATASFQAALQLGFRRHFQGAPGHLLVRAQQEPLPDETGHRRFLIVFDAVPGGTGYLSELWQGDTFFRVLEGALRALVVCDCRKDPTKDGCYRCLYAYQEQRNLEIISSRLAERMLKEILDKEGELAEVGTLSDLPMDILLESELERRFLSLLLNRIAEIPRASWKQVVSHGQACYRISLPIELPGKGTQDIVWDIVPQENLGPREGVDVPCRPDFIFKPRLPQNLREGVSTRPLPLAVFCDGLAYHVKPDQPLGGIADDIRKRTSLLHSHHFHVWSLTWKDVEGFASGSDALPQTAIFGRVPLTGVNQLWEMTSSRRTAVPSWPKREAGRLGSMEMLIEYLRNPWDEAWRDLARCYLLQWVSAGPLLSVEAARRAEERLELEPRRFTLPVDSPGSATGPGRPDTISRADVQGWLAALVRADSRGLSEGDLGAVWCLLRLFDEAEGRSAPEFETSWRSFLQAWNLVQFHDGVRVVSSECPPDVYEEAFAPTEAPLAAESAVGPVADAGPNSEDAYESLLELATAASRALLLALRGRCLPAPQFDFELPGDPGRCGPQADLAWPELLVAILSEQQLEDQGAFERAGFLVWSHPVDVTAVTDELARRSTNPPASSSNGKESR